jgi:hypothetical protein
LNPPMAATRRPNVVPHSIMKSSHAVNRNISLNAFLVPAFCFFQPKEKQ